MLSPFPELAPSPCLQAKADDVAMLAQEVNSLVLRTDFNAPGYCVVKLLDASSSIGFRAAMLELKDAMSEIVQRSHGEPLACVSAARFDQQNSTKPHLDAGPEQNFLLLGYEPTNVESDLQITDYCKCAFDDGVSPLELLIQHNPMLRSGRDALSPFTTQVPCFANSDFRIVCINNSSAPYGPEQRKWQGVLHTAIVPRVDESSRRVINSMMLAPSGLIDDQLSQSELEEFARTSVVRRRGYDKPHLRDD